MSDRHVKLLYANDKVGEHAPSWYNDTCPTPPQQPLESHEQTDVCIVGAGFTGLSAALELRKRGIDCIVLEAHRIGWGASGRNGGQLGTGFNKDQLELESLMGMPAARKLWEIAEQAKTWIHDVCDQHAIDIEYQPGIVYAQHRRRTVNAAHQYCDHLQKHYGYDAMQPLDANTIQDHVYSDYHGGVIDNGAGHIHPLKLTQGLASAALNLGAVIYERSEVLRIQDKTRCGLRRVVTSSGSISCKRLILATNGYIDSLDKSLDKRLMPINNFIVVTEPIGDLAAQLLPHNDAVADSRFVVNYFRRVDGDRLLFGGGENYFYRFPPDIASLVRKAMLGVFPQLSEAKIEYAWGGTLAITRNRLPYVAEFKPQCFTAGGYSGHGVALACMYGKILADKLAGNSKQFTVLDKLPNKPFPGGVRMRPALLALAMTGYSWLDKL